MTKIAILDDYQNVALSMADWSVLPEHVEISVFDEYIGDSAELAQRLAGFEVICIMRERTPFGRDLIERLPALKLLVTTGMRNLSFDMDAARQQGIVVSGTGMLGYAAAEHALALIFALFKKIPLEHQTMRDGGWQGAVSEGMNGKTLGLLGLGKLGSQVAAVGLALGMDVIAWSENLGRERCRDVGVTHVGKDALFAESDVISIHLVLSDRTRGLVGATELTCMKPTAYLVNTSRGPIVDTDALVKALDEQSIAGCALDTTDPEPLTEDHPLRERDNVIINPHVAWYSEQAMTGLQAGAPNEVRRVLEGEWPVNVVNKAVKDNNRAGI